MAIDYSNNKYNDKVIVIPSKNTEIIIMILIFMTTITIIIIYKYSWLEIQR